MKNTISVSTTYYTDGKIKNFQYNNHSSDFEKFKKDAIFSADYLAKLHKGTIGIEETKTSLYINYFDVPGCDKIDTMYILQN